MAWWSCSSAIRTLQTASPVHWRKPWSKILDFALDSARDETPAVPLDRLTGRFVNPWGVTDIVKFGNTLKAISPEADNPLERVNELEAIDADTLRIADAPGYASPGETIRYDRDAGGRTTRVRIGGGSSFPVEVYRERFGSQVR